MLIAIVLIPLLAALAALSRKIQAAVFAVSGSVLVFVLSILLLIKIGREDTISRMLPGLPGMPFVLQADFFAALLVLIVSTVALSIFIYATGYMKSEPGKTAFWSGMSLFLASMLLLVLAADWISFIVGWEMMGFASYRLIATWHEKKEARDGAAKAFIITRFTDMGLYIAVFLIILQSGTSLMLADVSHPMQKLAGFALLFAVMGKSAQVPFQDWLSKAMAGPTPVSAFLHSATMVAAGIILLIRAFPMLPHEILPWIGFTGGITILLTGFTAMFSDDVKQMLAASTSSHLGFMLLAIGAGFPGAAAGHLLAHAFMKSSLFLGAGIWQQAYGSTSFEKLHAAGRHYKFTYSMFVIATVALAGIPPLIGYFSKDAILAAGLEANHAFWYFSAAGIGTILTAIYSGRAAHLLWIGKDANAKRNPLLRNMQGGMLILVLVVLAGGFFLKPVLHAAAMEMPHSPEAVVTGIVLAVAGLAGGWLIMAKPFHDRITAHIANNLPVAGGFDALVVSPVMRLTEKINEFENGLTGFIMKTGATFYRLSLALGHADLKVENGTRFIGALNLRFSRLSRIADDTGIHEAVRTMAAFVKKSGSQSRKIQSGLVHRELLWSVIGFIGFLMILIFTNL